MASSPLAVPPSISAFELTEVVGGEGCDIHDEVMYGVSEGKEGGWLIFWVASIMLSALLNLCKCIQ